MSGINLVTLLWTDGDRLVPVDSRISDKKKYALTKNDHFQATLLASVADGRLLSQHIHYTVVLCGQNSQRVGESVGRYHKMSVL